MTWRDRDPEPDEEEPLREAGRLGGDWQGVRPTLDDPMSWSVPVGRVRGISVRLHFFFLVFIAVELLRAAFATPEQGTVTLGLAPVLILLVCLWWSVLLHEFGHCVACRVGGGEADEILMWPLGGLAWCRPAPSWAAHLATAAGGPLVNVALLAVSAVPLGVLTGKWLGVALPSPFHLSGLAEVHESWWLTALFLLGWVNLVLLLFNLLPIFPFDGGRMVQALLWPRLGYAGAMRVAVRTGFVGAVALGVLGFVQEEIMVVAVAFFGGLVCYQTNKRLEFTQQVLGFEPGPEGELVLAPEPSADPEKARRAAEQERRSAEAEQLDRILTKINESGLASLTARERRVLREATERRRTQDRRGPG